MRNWIYDESKHCGVDYSKAKQAESYDEQHQKFRDYRKEFNQMLEFLELKNTSDQAVIDLGCGTGATALFAAGLFKSVHAVDISDVMLEKARGNLPPNRGNIRFIKGGFLSYHHDGEPVDLIITKAAFHHLPDFWKQIALLRMNQMLKMNGVLYIHDVVFQFDPQQYVGKIDSWIAKFEQVVGDEFKAEVETHIRDEYSTFGWILEKMIEKAGFVIEKMRSDDGFVSEYACRKVKQAGFEESER